MGNRKIFSEEALALTPTVLTSIEAYKQIAETLPVSEGLLNFEKTSVAQYQALANWKTDLTAVDVRMMLQRKYFVRSEKIYLPNLVETLAKIGCLDSASVSKLLDKLKLANNQPVALSLSDGRTLKCNYDIVEQILYGAFLHADSDKVALIRNLDPTLRLLVIASFIIEREEFIYGVYDLLKSLSFDDGIKDEGKASIVSWSKDGLEDKSVSSPFWTNVMGHDAAEQEIVEIAASSSLDDVFILTFASTFFNLLVDDQVKNESLRQMIWEDFWDDCNDFDSVREFARSIKSPGISTHVSHEGGDEYAQVKILPNVERGWITNTPQLFQVNGAKLMFTKRNGIWKVNCIVGSVA